MTHKTIPRPIASNRQIEEYLRAVSKGGRYVVANGNGWHLFRPDSRKRLAFNTKAEAVTKAREELAGTDGKVFIFNKAGHLSDTLVP